MRVSNSHGLPRLAWCSRLAVGVTHADAAACGMGYAVALLNIYGVQLLHGRGLGHSLP